MSKGRDKNEEGLGGLWTKNLQTVAKLFTKKNPTRRSIETLSSIPETRPKHNRVPETKWGPKNQVGLILFKANITSEILLTPLDFDFG